MPPIPQEDLHTHLWVCQARASPQVARRVSLRCCLPIGGGTGDGPSGWAWSHGGRKFEFQDLEGKVSTLLLLCPADPLPQGTGGTDGEGQARAGVPSSRPVGSPTRGTQLFSLPPVPLQSGLYHYFL